MRVLIKTRAVVPTRKRNLADDQRSSAFTLVGECPPPAEKVGGDEYRYLRERGHERALEQQSQEGVLALIGVGAEIQVIEGLVGEVPPGQEVVRIPLSPLREI